MSNDEDHASGCRVLLRMQIFSLYAPELITATNLNANDETFVSLQLRRGKKMASTAEKCCVDVEGTSLVFNATLLMCVTLFGDGMGSFYDSFGKLSISIGNVKGITGIPFHECHINMNDTEHQQIVLPVSYPTYNAECNMTILATFIEDVFTDAIPSLSDDDSTDGEDIDTEINTQEEVASTDFDDGGFYGKSMHDHYHLEQQKELESKHFNELIIKTKMIRNMEEELQVLKETLSMKSNEVLYLQTSLQELNSRVQNNSSSESILLEDLEIENQQLKRQIEDLKSALAVSESVSASTAFDTELKWTDEIDRLETQMAELKAETEFAAQRHEEEVLSLLDDNTKFRAEIRTLENEQESSQIKLEEYERKISTLQNALEESKKSALKLQQSLSSLSDTASQLESDIQTKVGVSNTELQNSLLNMKEALRAQWERAEIAESNAKKSKFDLEEKDAEFNMVLQDLIKSRLEYAQLASEVDEKNKQYMYLETQVREGELRIQQLEEESKKKRKGLF